MYYGNEYLINENWSPTIYCNNLCCHIRPELRTKSTIRRKQKINIPVIKEKVEIVINYWNEGNNICPYEGIELDFMEIAKEGLKYFPGAKIIEIT